MQDHFAFMMDDVNRTSSNDSIQHYMSGQQLAEMLKPWINNRNFVLIIVTYSITFLVGIIGNIIIVNTMTREKTSRNATSMFLVSLAVADLLLLIICTPLETLQYFLPSWDQGPLCKLGTYVKTLSAVASVLNLTAVSFERYVVIVYPMRSRALCTMSNCRRALIIVWLVACLLSMPITVTKSRDPVTYFNNESSITIYYCMDTKEDEGLPLILAIYQFIIMFALPLLLMSYCYARVIKELWMSTVTMSAMTRLNSSTQFDSRSSISGALRNSTQMTSTSSSTNSFIHRNSPTRLSSNSDDVKQARKQVIKMLILVILLFLVCWGPYLILNIMIKVGLELYTPSMYSLRVAFTLLPFVHSCLNPIIYSFMSSNFRRMMMRTCSNQSCGTVPTLCCQKGSNVRLRYKSANYDLGINGESRRSHAHLHHTCSNTCSSDVRTSPITECETMILDKVSFA